ncbi:glucose-1-phosphate cytidylyltransferase [Spirochaetia bacterium]|nr:glucose-1-phosphate cytidylyltransferase [Spirochaetia bacterium]
MKVVILAGGLGTRITEESFFKPKPMIEIGGRPILWHIMKSYLYQGFDEFVICAGYKQDVIKEYFEDYYLHHSDVTFDFTEGFKSVVHKNIAEPWKVTIVDTGLNTLTGGRVKRIKEYIGDETFMLTYGDGVCDLNIQGLLDFHKKQKKLATITAVQPGGRFGTLDIAGDGTVHRFTEKNKDDGGWINGGFMVLEPAILDYIEGDGTTLEKQPLERLAAEGQLSAYLHNGFWQCMDTMRDKQVLDDLIQSGKASWIKWK